MRCAQCYAPLLVGHRFCGHCGHAVAADPPSKQALERTGNKHGADDAEFRLLSIVFSDLADSTGLTGRLGAERFRELLRDYRETAARVFAKYGGHVARYVGDGTLVYFGYPRAYEDNTRRAVHAAFELLAAVRKLRPGFEARWKVDLHARAAVHTGMVVAGDIRSETTNEAMAVVGDAPNVAAHLQELAEPGTVLITSTAYELVDQDFACTCLGPRMLKGVPLPVVTYRVDDVATVRTRFDARPRKGELIGREDEARRLAIAWAETLAGRGRAVLIRGEPGIGKSRLIAGLLGDTEKGGARHAVLQCSPIYQNTALYPFTEHLTALFGLSPEQTEAEQIARIETTFLWRDLDPAQYVPLFASLLGIRQPNADAAQLQPFPQEERERLKQRIGDWLIHVAAHRPILLVVEDLHWADPSSVELLSELLPRLAGARVLVVMSARDEFDPGLLGSAPRIDIDLRRLGHDDAMRMIQAIARGRLLPRSTIDLLRSKTDGVPLYIKEMTRAVLEAEIDVYGEGDALLAVPATLSESLVARIGRVAASRELLAIMASLGREFDLELLSALWEYGAESLRTELDNLIAARLLRETTVGRARIMFRHALIQETIYDSLLASRRRRIHGKIAETLTAVFPRAAEDRPELLAHHYRHAGQDREALAFLHKAAKRAIHRSAHVEARRHLRSALEIAEAMPADQECVRLEAELLLSLGVALTASDGYASDEVGGVFARARELCRALDPAADLFPVLHGLYRFYYMRAELGCATELADQMLSIARSHQAQGLLVEAHRAAGNCCFTRGLFDEAEEHFAEASSRYDPVAHAAHRYIYALDPLVGAESYRALNAWCRGDRAGANARIIETLSAAERLDHPFSLAWALSFAALIHSLEDDLDRLRDTAERLVAFAEQHFFPFWRSIGLMSLGWWLHRSGSDRIRGVAIMQDGLAGSELMGTVRFRPYFMSLLGRAYLDDGKVEQAREILDAALELTEPRGNLWWVPALRRLRTLCDAVTPAGFEELAPACSTTKHGT